MINENFYPSNKNLSDKKAITVPKKLFQNRMNLLDKIDSPFGEPCWYDTIVCHKTTCPELAAKVKSTRRRLVWYN